MTPQQQQHQHRPPTSSLLKQQLQPPLPAHGIVPRRPAKTPVAPLPDPLDIDAQSFDARKYLKKALLEQGVSELLATDIQLVGQVRQIDGDMKTMVYENYSKFISATETIGKMKADADFMDAEMERLSRRVNDISARTDSVNAHFAQRRTAIARLSDEHRTLKRLQFLFDLPDELNRYISKGQFVEAARVWARTLPLLEHYRQLGVFATVEKDGKEIMASVEATIWARWRQPGTGMAEGAECASLLVLLRPESTRELWREYLEIQGAKNHAVRHDALDNSYKFPTVCDPALHRSSSDEPLNVADSNGGPLAAAPVKVAAATGTTRLSYFNDHYLPAWSSLVVGFASQFVSPSGSGLLDQTTTTTPVARNFASAGEQSGRTMSLLEATTEGTVVGLLSPLAEDNQAQLMTLAAKAASAVATEASSNTRREQMVVGWQAMSSSELAEAQQAFAEHMREWCTEYEFIVDSLIHFPDDATQANAPAYLAQVDELMACASRFPILARIGGLRDCLERVAARWQQRLVDGALHTIVRDMIERLEYYFDPTIDQADTSLCVATPLQISATGSLPRSSGIMGSRHQRNASVKSTGSQTSHPPILAEHHQRSGSVMSNTWSVGAIPPTAGVRGLDPGSSPMGLGATQSALTPHSPLQVVTQHQQSAPPANARGLAHARAVSSAFEALSNSPTVPLTASLSLSPALTPYGTAGGSGGSQRLGRASTASAATARLLIHNNSSSSAGGSANRTGVLRRTRHHRSHSSAYIDSMYEPLDDLDRPAVSDADPAASSNAPPQMRRSLSLHRTAPAVRRYRPWLVNTVNRNSPLHVYLADVESWLIQQVLERVNPLLETVVQHYLDIEASQMLEDDDDDGFKPVGMLALQSATRMRQSFIKTLDDCLNTWMSSWIPDAFLYAALENPVHGTREYVEQAIADSPMALFGISTLSDPVSSLLLARFAVDFELTLTQSIYQLCEHAISILPDEANGHSSRRMGRANSAQSSADVSMSNLLSTPSRNNDLPPPPPPPTGSDQQLTSDRVYSITASLAARNDSMASVTSRRGTFALGGGQRSGNVLNPHRTEHAAKWHGVAEQLVRHFVLTVGQDISSDYLSLHPYDHSMRLADDAVAYNRRVSTYSVSSADLAPFGVVSSVSEVWLNICSWMRQVEDDTNALFYDPVFSATTKALEAYQATHGDHASDPANHHYSPVSAHPKQQSAIGGFTGANALRLGVGTNSDNQAPPLAGAQHGGYNPLMHAHILSNIDRLFAERVDVFPKRITSLASGQILFHLAVQIVKSAIEALRLSPGILQTGAEYQQVVVDSAFVRSWMLRYAGVSPNLQTPSAAPVFGQQQQDQSTAFGAGEQRRRSAMAHSSSNANLAGAATASSLSSTINERNAQVIQNLIDDWIGSAKACAVEQVLPDTKLVDRVVRNAWTSVYFAYDTTIGV
ncbi:hypothetical protein GGI20_003940 [Coemansia sp. BCRC 34301]|nr:hypothetical protein GGI20_003940 [Coemansia sp. BCRC 34301]